MVNVIVKENDRLINIYFEKKLKKIASTRVKTILTYRKIDKITSASKFKKVMV